MTATGGDADAGAAAVDPDRWSGEFREVSHVMLDEATSAEVGYVGTEHLLLALLQHRDAELATAASRAGLDADAVRELLASRQQPAPRPAPTSLPYSPALLEVLATAGEYADRLGIDAAGSAVVALALADARAGVASALLAEIDPGSRWRRCLPDAERIELDDVPGPAAATDCAIESVRLSVTGSQRWIALEYDPPADTTSSATLLRLLQPSTAWSERSGFAWMAGVRDDSRSGVGRVVISMAPGADVSAALEELRQALAPISITGSLPKPRPKPVA